MMRAVPVLIVTLLAVLFAPLAQAQTYDVQSITEGALGTIVSAPSGSSTFRAESSSGAVTLQSGSAVRLSGNSVNSVVTIRCTSSILCGSTNVYVTLELAGTPSGRLAYIPSINLTNGTATITSAYSAGSYVVINLNPIPRNASRTFILGYDVPVLGNDSGQPSGNAVTSFLITASRSSGAGADSLVGNITARVIRPINISKTADLQFGRVTRPTSGTGSLTLTPDGAASATGTNVIRFPSPTPTAADFTVTGEGGQAVTVSVPSTVTLSGTAGSVVATTSATGSGSQVLSGSTGSAGSLQVRVGGSIPLSDSTPMGTLTGTLAVTVQYN